MRGQGAEGGQRRPATKRVPARMKADYAKTAGPNRVRLPETRPRACKVGCTTLFAAIGRNSSPGVDRCDAARGCGSAAP